MTCEQKSFISETTMMPRTLPRLVTPEASVSPEPTAQSGAFDRP